MSNSELPQGVETMTVRERGELVASLSLSYDACAGERKLFNLCRSRRPTSVVFPEFCLKEAQDFFDCVQKFRRRGAKLCPEQLETFVDAFEANKALDEPLKKFINCAQPPELKL